MQADLEKFRAVFEAASLKPLEFKIRLRLGDQKVTRVYVRTHCDLFVLVVVGSALTRVLLITVGPTAGPLPHAGFPKVKGRQSQST